MPDKRRIRHRGEKRENVPKNFGGGSKLAQTGLSDKLTEALSIMPMICLPVVVGVESLRSPRALIGMARAFR
jgi:hypothetical protein